VGGSINLPFGKNLLSVTCRVLESELESEQFPHTFERGKVLILIRRGKGAEKGEGTRRLN